MPGPLSGFKVVDLSAILSGPMAAQVLADQGADVVKVETLELGDLMRTGTHRRGGLAAFYTNANRGKRCIALDLRKAAGRDVVLALVKEADVLIQNFRPGAVERLGLGEPACRALNERLVYCSISGYGDSGPYRDRRVYDPIIQGLTGFVAIQQNPEVPIPDLIRNVVCDKASAWTAAQAVTAALLERERSGVGQHVRVPMIDAALAFFWPDGMMAHTILDQETTPGPTLYDVYALTETQDGHLIYFVASDAEHHGLFRALGHPEWVDDERFTTMRARTDEENRLALGAALLKAFREWPTGKILERLVAEEVPAGPVHSIESMLEDPQLAHNESIRVRPHPTAGRIREARPAARFERTPLEPTPLAPLAGEHTAEILAELGYDAAAQGTLRADGVIT